MSESPLTPYAYQALLIVHVMAAMFWFGVTASIPRRIREAIRAETDGTLLALRSIAGQGKSVVGAGAVVLLTGISLALLHGFPKVSPLLPVRFHVALLLTLIWFAIGALLTRPAIGTLTKTAAEALGPDAIRLQKRISMLVGIQHLLFTVITILMLWRL